MYKWQQEAKAAYQVCLVKAVEEEEVVKGKKQSEGGR